MRSKNKKYQLDNFDLIFSAIIALSIFLVSTHSDDISTNILKTIRAKEIDSGLFTIVKNPLEAIDRWKSMKHTPLNENGKVVL